MPGFKMQRVNLENGGYEDFLVNKSGRPASTAGVQGLERPIRLDWAPDGSLYVVDFGRIDFEETGMAAHPNNGKVWKVIRTSGASALPPVQPQDKEMSRQEQGCGYVH